MAEDAVFDNDSILEFGFGVFCHWHVFLHVFQFLEFRNFPCDIGGGVDFEFLSIKCLPF